MKRDELHLSTRAVHSELDEKRVNRPVVSPIYLSATFEAADVEEQIRLQAEGDTFYTRYGNPTLTAVERTLAALEGTESALVFGCRRSRPPSFPFSVTGITPSFNGRSMAGRSGSPGRYSPDSASR